MRPAPPIRRLSRSDTSYLRYETRAAPTQVGALVILDGGPLFDAAGGVRLDEIRRRLERRLTRVPVLRRRLLRPGPLQGRPVWIDDAAFDIARHVRHFTVPAPGEDGQLMTAVEGLMGIPLRRDCPLWELWVIGGLQDSRLAMLLKLHHSIADGLAAVAMMASLFDLDASAPDPPPEPWEPEPAPQPRELLVDGISARVRAAGRHLGALRHGHAVREAAEATGAELWRVLRAPSAPRTSLNRPVRSGRRIRFIRLDLEKVRAAAHAGGGTVNDVVLTVVAGGLRDLLLERREAVDRPLIASVPVSLRRAAEATGLGNAVGTIAVPLDVSEYDARRRLRRIVEETRRAKREQHPEHISAAMDWVAATPLAQRFITRQHLVNLFITNVMGPPVPMYAFGARILDALPIVSPLGNVAVAFCAFSYAGTLYVVSTADATACPDVDRLTAAIRREWDGLVSPATSPDLVAAGLSS